MARSAGSYILGMFAALHKYVPDTQSRMTNPLSNASLGATARHLWSVPGSTSSFQAWVRVRVRVRVRVTIRVTLGLALG